MNCATSNAVINRFGSPLFADTLPAGGCVVSAVCADSVYVVFLIDTLRACAASNVCDRRLVLGLTNRVGMVRRKTIGLRPSARVADSGRRDPSARVKRSLESHADGRCRCVADVRDASYPSLLVRYDLSWEKSRARPCRWVTGP